MKNPEGNPGQTSIKFNQGQTLVYLASNYPRLQDVVLELVQNALDMDVQATRIWINVNYMTRYLAVRDNGAGSSIERFNSALASVAEPNRKGTGSLGQFGIGLISPLGKCDLFTFTSCPTPHKALYQEWTFHTAHIAAQKENLTIPTRPRTDLIFNEKVSGKMNKEWRSEMALTRFTTDEYVSRIVMADLIGGIQDRYAAVMRRNKVLISICIVHPDGTEEKKNDVAAPEFRGKKLEEHEMESDEAGRTRFNLYLAPKTSQGRTGKVLMGVMGNDFRFPFHYFARAAAKLLKEEVVTALCSGLFEGEILSEKAKLHPNRKTFEKDEAYIGLCVAVETWYDEVGEQYLEEARQSRQEERHQQLGQRSIKVLQQLLKEEGHAALANLVNSMPGTKPNKGESGTRALAGKDDYTSPDKPSTPDSDKKGDEGQEQPKPPPDKPSLTVTGPKGPRRKTVRRDGFGLQFSHEAMEGSPDLWKFEIEFGLLRFNIRHPLWIACDERSDVALMKLQELVAIQALTLHLMPENLRIMQRQVLDELNHSLVTWILKGDRARGTGPGAKKSKEMED